MERKKKKFTNVLVAFIVSAMAFSSMPGLTMINANDAQQTAVEKDYEIYPTPQSISYSGGNFVIHPTSNIVYDDTIDEATKNRIQEIFIAKGVTLNVSDKKQEGTTNILVGTFDSKQYAGDYISKKVSATADFFNKIDANILDVDNGTISILGKNTDGAFYAATSLKHILNQMEGKTIRNLRMDDFASTKTRGFIEGYYGIPWSNENRMSLMEFGGDFKMTSYVFAPKDDPYHSSKWRDLYPADKLAEIAEMAKVGNAAKCKFVWTIHPFMHNPITAANYDESLAIIESKFEQLYTAGVRQFGVLGDDAGGLPRTVIIKLMEDLQAWIDAKGDVYNLVFCPQGYNDAWQGDYSELNQLDQGFPKDVQIFWTGQAVCQPVEQATLNNFKRKNLNGNPERRSPLFWLNWPVNDINGARLMMGKGSLLHNDINVNDLGGVVTNPMQEAQASKVALFAVADYAWNVSAFNDDKSWEDSFKYIDNEAAKELHTIAKHISDPAPNGHGLVLGESEELKPLLDTFKSKLDKGESIIETGNQLIAEYETIIEACNDFDALSKNVELKKEINPWRLSLTALSEATISYIKTAMAIDNSETDAVWSNFASANAKFKESKTFLRTNISGSNVVQAGAKRLIPFATDLNKKLEPIVTALINPEKQVTTIITNRTDTPTGALTNLTDGDTATDVIWKSPNSVAINDYLGIIYSKSIKLKKVEFSMGNAGNSRDGFNDSKLQYTKDGKTWIDIPNATFTSADTVLKVEGLDLDVKGVRAIATSVKSNVWFSCKEIVINDGNKPEGPKKLVGTALYNDAKMSIKGGTLANIADNSNTTYAHFAKGPYVADENDRDTTIVDAFVGLTFDAVKEIGDVVIKQDTSDKINKGVLEYSVDGTNWLPLATYDSVPATLTRNCKGVRAKAIRLRNTEKTEKWWKVFDVSVYEPSSETEPSIPLDKTIIKS
ncbi:MAG: beta-N-acetylglucosaminidase domain-containing protein, partial [Longicatena sp.]